MWLPDMPDGGWKKVAVATGIVTLLVCVLAVLGTVLANTLAGQPTDPVDIYAAIVLSNALTVPIFGYLMVKILELRRANDQLHYFATFDSLTGARNRRSFMEQVEVRLLKNSRGATRADSALLVVDVDHFKVINDRYGHQTGDLALVRIADTLRANLREGDLFGRIGGEEFGIFLDDMSPAAAIGLAERCRISITQCPFTPNGEDHALSISVGVAIASKDEDFTELFSEADRRLYIAKEQGRNRIESPAIPFAA